MTLVDRNISKSSHLRIKDTWNILECLFGPRDPRFVFGAIRESKDNVPRTHFLSNYHTNGDCVVYIHIGKPAWEIFSPDQSEWQLAHECVHLIDPGEYGSANVLEEGLATWFQCEPQYHDKLVKDYMVSIRAISLAWRLTMLRRGAWFAVACRT